MVKLMCQMKIEIAKLGRMSQTGSSLMTLYQDKHTPVLDLLVRESIQNCLDAGNYVHPNAENKKFVELSFLTGDFCPSKFNELLEGSTEALNKRYPESKARYLAIRDKYAVGLTGPLRMSEVKDYKYGNLLKLVYDICKPQEGAGAGGSWGIGKTIFFRIGMGLVVYYSRIWDEKNNKFSSRFAVSIVEDEHSEDAIIPKDGEASNTGIAWWGNYVNNEETEPITDEDEIDGYLEIFGIQPYVDKETGTTVIVPYIDEDALLTNNRFEETDEVEFAAEHIVPSWMHSIDDYLSIAAQRWYFPRLNNPSYIFGRYLKLYINDKLLKKSDMQPLFLYWQNLYNCAILNTTVCDTDYVEEIDIHLEKINLNKYLKDTCAGRVAFATIGRDSLGMCPPDNLYSPYVCTDTDDSEGETNKPLMAFCRMPGMIVNYKGNEEWLKSVPYTEKDGYLIAIFALNSENILEINSQTLEEYVRKSELADHHSWDDYNTGSGKKSDIISKIKWHTAKKIARAFEAKTEDTDEKTDSGWGKIMADIILPKEGFGTRSTRRNVNPSRLTYESHKSISIALSDEDTAYYGDTMEFTYYIKSREKTSSFNLNLYIGTEGKAISSPEWEKDGLALPFEVNSILLRMDKLDGAPNTNMWRIDSNDTTIFDNLITIKNNKTTNGITYGLSVQFQAPHTFLMSSTFAIKVISRNVKPLLISE